MQDAFAALNKKAGVAPAPEPVKKPTPPTKPSEPAKVEPPKKEPEPTETPKPEEVPVEATKPAEPPPKAKRPSDYLREEMTKWKGKAEQLEAELKKSREAPPAEHPEVKSLSEKLTAAEKRAQELDQIVRHTAYERSQEFRTQFDQPFLDSYAAGAAKVKALKVTLKTADPDTGAESVQERAGTLEDWEAITGAPTESAAADEIEKRFGTGVRAQMVTQHYMETVAKFRSKQDALASAAKTAEQRHKQAVEMQTNLHKEIGAMWQEQIKPESVPDQWKPYVLPKGTDKDGKPIDAEWDAALEKGYAQYDKAVSEDARQPGLTEEQRKAILGRAAANRHKAAAFTPLVTALRKMTERLAEAEKELEAYRTSEPGPGDAEPGKEQQQTTGTMGSVLAELQKRAGGGKPVFH
jgi:uncharacterized DUF497 family protein